MSSQYSKMENMKQVASIILRYFPLLCLGFLLRPPASLSARGPATKGPIKAIHGATIDTIFAWSIDSPFAVM